MVGIKKVNIFFINRVEKIFDVVIKFSIENVFKKKLFINIYIDIIVLMIS